MTSLDSVDSVDFVVICATSNYILNVFSNVVFEFRIPQEFRIHGSRTRLKFNTQFHVFLLCSALYSYSIFIAEMFKPMKELNEMF